MGWAKKIDPVKLAPAMSWIYRLWCKTLRYDIRGDWGEFRELWGSKRPIVVSIWHNELFSLPYFGVVHDIACVNVISQSKDGEVLARLLESLGFTSIRGSSSRGGVRALKEAIKVMKTERRACVVTVDGPKGPRHQAKLGVFLVTQKAGGVLVPIRLRANWKIVFKKAWDRFELPLPFSRVRVCLGQAMEVTDQKLSGETLEKEQGRLHEVMHALKDS